MKRYQHIRDNKAYGLICELLGKGLNQTSIAWHLNNRRPLIAPPYGAKEWTAVLVTNVFNCHEPAPAVLLTIPKTKGGK